MSTPRPDYNIFKDLDDYLTIALEVNTKYAEDTTSLFCNSITVNNNSKKQIIELCRKFVSFFNKLKSNYQNDSITQPTRKYPEYLNFWLNHQLKIQVISEEDKLVLYKHLQDNYQQLDEDSKLKNKLYNINDNDFKSMNMLYELYKNYNGPLSDYNDDCNNFLKKFKVNYDKCLYRCYAEGDSKLCAVMKKFRDLYDEKKFPRAQTCNASSQKLPKLSEYCTIEPTVSEDYNIGYQLVQTADTSIRYELPKLTEANHNELKDLIWLQYNMSFHYDEEKKKTYMMKVLYQFIFYCNENKKNLKLSLFMKEFIRKYYTTNEAEYKEIFTECEGKDNKEIYGQWYKNCKEKFGKDILLIRDNANSYVQQQENYIKELPTLDLLILKAKALFQDSESMSKYSTTIISIMISIFLCLFFLYKLTPLSSIFRKEKKRRKIPLFFPERSINDVKHDNSGNMKTKPKRGKIRFSYQPT
ncbi:PIR protein [Plasmodium vivax]|uniref:VIR protein n=1 Tax=Plasmodium vivax TaxID=5855 RepID=A0A565A530_PLAVI|nr:PIR protein [Plasmodium vivax]